MTLLFWLLVGHSLADYPLQGQFLALAKRRGGIGSTPWQIALAAHSLIHAGAVALITGSVALGLMEFAVHCLIDYAKCEGWFTPVWPMTQNLGEWEPIAQRRAFWIDQTLHVACKILWVALLFPGWFA